MLEISAPATWCKICGVTTLADLRSCEEYGADAVGFNCFPDSPRWVSVPKLVELSEAAAVTTVALFVDADRDRVAEILDCAQIDLLQFHGDEDEAFCSSFGKPYMKTIRMAPGIDVSSYAQRYGSAWALLLDTYVPGQPGGTGQVFDWQQWPAQVEQKLVLAGGLSAANVATAIRTLKPFGVDVCGGVEGEQKGLKDPTKLADFLQEVRSVSGK